MSAMLVLPTQIWKGVERFQYIKGSSVPRSFVKIKTPGRYKGEFEQTKIPGLHQYLLSD